LPIDPTIELSKLVPEKCHYFESKTFPLLLSFETIYGDEYKVIFKEGDDLRQDMLMLQMIKIMDKLWKKEGLECMMSNYNIIATASKSGLIEVVNARTIADIQMEQGGATQAFSKKYLLTWLSQQHSDEASLKNAIDNFTRSLAGSCVATYVLGIGDRHNDNIMLTKNGKVFHIDFGRVLGHWEKFVGISRDRAPFIFTKEFAYVIDSDKSWQKSPKMKEFIDMCCKGYNILRKNAGLFLNLFSLMLSTGIPELQSSKDIDYLKETLCLSMTDQDASNFFTSLIWKSLNTKATKLNFFVHNVANLKAKRKT